MPKVLPYSSPIQTLTVGFRISLNPPPKAGHGLKTISLSITAGWEFHPAPKNIFYLVFFLLPLPSISKGIRKVDIAHSLLSITLHGNPTCIHK
jgi:hypothetical protein